MSLEDQIYKLQDYEIRLNDMSSGFTGCIAGCNPCPHCICQSKLDDVTSQMAALQNVITLREGIEATNQARKDWLASTDTTCIYAVFGDSINSMTIDQLITMNNTLRILANTYSIDQLKALYAN
uniref:Uncharacterized protein n=1 Tax=viral metagenome TaxID=1070528 RepID=A0A6C0JQK8_9ZZZZ